MEKTSIKKLLALLLAVLLLGVVGCKKQEEHKEESNMIKMFGCDALAIDAETVSNELERFYLNEAEAGRKNGYTPVIVLAGDALIGQVENNYSKSGGDEAYIKAYSEAAVKNHADALKSCTKWFEDYYDGFSFTVDEAQLDEWTMALKNGNTGGLQLPLFYDGEAYLVRVPTNEPYRVFAWIPFGGWNGCPDTEDLMAVTKHWYEKYGAVPALISSDMLYLHLDAPVADKNTAVEIAKEQCAFCIDGMGTIGFTGYVAAVLLNNVWSFWWD